MKKALHKIAHLYMYAYVYMLHPIHEIAHFVKQTIHPVFAYPFSYVQFTIKPLILNIKIYI